MALNLVRGSAADIDRFAEIIVDGWSDDDFWVPMVGSSSREEQIAYTAGLFKEMFAQPFHEYWTIRDGDSKIAGWTCLQVPVQMTTEQKSQHPSLPDPPKGFNAELVPVFFQVLGCGERHGYDPEKHCHRRGTFIDPAYQKRGLGTRLTKQCSSVADKHGAKTYVPARPSSKPMFENCGYKVVEALPVDMEPYTGKKYHADFWLLTREPETPCTNGH